MTDDESLRESAEKYSYTADGLEEYPSIQYNERLQEAFLAGCRFMQESAAYKVDKNETDMDARDHMIYELTQRISSLESMLNQGEANSMENAKRMRELTAQNQKLVAALGSVKTDIDRRMNSDDICRLPFDEDLSDAVNTIEEALADHDSK